jgi:hypothetical protein
MREIHTDIEIAAPPERVWQVLTDLGSYPQWNPLVTRASGDLRVGGRLEISVQVPDASLMRFKPVVLKLEPARELRWLGTLPLPGLFNGEHSFRLEPAGPGRTRFLHGERFTGLLVPVLALLGIIRKTERGYVLMNEALKARVEAGGQ